MASGRFRELLKKYGKVALGVHFSVSAVSISGLYVAIKNNVDVESMLEKVGMGGVSTSKEEENPPEPTKMEPAIDSDSFVIENQEQTKEVKTRNRTAEMAATSGGALALAVLCNKALFPVRVPITFMLTPQVAKFLAKRRLKTGV